MSCEILHMVAIEKNLWHIKQALICAYRLNYHENSLIKEVSVFELSMISQVIAYE